MNSVYLQVETISVETDIKILMKNVIIEILITEMVMETTTNVELIVRDLPMNNLIVEIEKNNQMRHVTIVLLIFETNVRPYVEIEQLVPLLKIVILMILICQKELFAYFVKYKQNVEIINEILEKTVKTVLEMFLYAMKTVIVYLIHQMNVRAYQEKNDLRLVKNSIVLELRVASEIRL